MESKAPQIYTIPNVLTCGNLLCGCLGIVETFAGNMHIASYLIVLAAILDFFDGFVARALKIKSDVGKELDSLADCVTFGILPAIMVFKFLEPSALVIHSLFPYIAFLLAIFSALRLAKFNVDTRQSDSFVGVPTPANAMVIASFPLICVQYPDVCIWVQNPYILAGYSVGMSMLLVAELPLFALKFKNFGFGDNKIRYIFLLSAFVMLIVGQSVAIPIVILVYVILSILQNLMTK